MSVIIANIIAAAVHIEGEQAVAVCENNNWT